MGSHAAVKAFLAPTIDALRAAYPEAEVSYNGCGGIVVDFQKKEQRKAFEAPQWFASRRITFTAYTFGPNTYRVWLEAR